MLDETTYHPNPSVAERDVRSARKGIFCKEGEYWTIGYGANIFRLKDSKGARVPCLSAPAPDCLCGGAQHLASALADARPLITFLYQSSRLHPSSQHSFHK